jgi:hypothetical protein
MDAAVASDPVASVAQALTPIAPAPHHLGAPGAFSLVGRTLALCESSAGGPLFSPARPLAAPRSDAGGWP